MFDQLEDTIVAVSSPPGTSPRGIVRLSGPRAGELAGTVFESVEGPGLKDTGGWRRLSGRARVDENARVPAEAYIFRSPASYTRQDLIELHIPGAPALLAMVLDTLKRAGARPAEPGEFTARAFLAGAMDLTEVEGVAALISAQNDSQLRASEALLHGQLSRQSTRWRDELADLLASIEARIDFAEEPEEFISTRRIRATIEQILTPLEQLCRAAPAAERLEVLPTVVLVGRPNAGKSTLFNRLTGMDRAIQSATAGTTRDLLVAPMTLPGGEVLLVDSAGLTSHDRGDECPTGDEPAHMAEQASRQAIREADAVILVADVCEPLGPAAAAFVGSPRGQPVGIAANKVDLLTREQREAWIRQAGVDVPMAAVGAHTGEGIEALRSMVHDLLFADRAGHEVPAITLSNRQREALSEASEALGRARGLCDEASPGGEPAELVAAEVRAAMNALSLLTGEIVTEDLLERIFTRFCIGK
ncbi:MAG TPA: tRNA modification GTPase [Phycisphaerae bacterium]|nr:tRNA modification GTPase [Phycisphaerae bacterium]